MESSTVSPEQLVAPGRGGAGQHAVPARHEERGLGERHVAVGQVHAGQVTLQVVDAHHGHAPAEGQRLGRGDADQQRADQARSRRHRYGGQVASRRRRPRRGPARRSGVIVSTWARLASSGTTPPNAACRSIWLATTDERTARSSSTTAAAVSSHDVSMASRQPGVTAPRASVARDLGPRDGPFALDHGSVAAHVDQRRRDVRRAARRRRPGRRRGRGRPPRRGPCAAWARRAGWRW